MTISGNNCPEMEIMDSQDKTRRVELRVVMDAADAFLAQPPDSMEDCVPFHQYTTAGDCRALNEAYREAAGAAGGE